MSTEPFLTCGALARALGIGRETVRQLTLRGVLTAYRPSGRRLYLESEARAAIRGSEAKPFDLEATHRAGVAAVMKLRKQRQSA